MIALDPDKSLAECSVTVSRGRDGQAIDYVGIVICRQQPGTAAGVVELER